MCGSECEHREATLYRLEGSLHGVRACPTCDTMTRVPCWGLFIGERLPRWVLRVLWSRFRSLAQVFT